MKGDFDSFNELNAADSDAIQVIQNMLFMSLTRLDENLQFAPYLAASWEFGPGDTVLTYHLRKDVLWTDGQPTTAEDVLFTYQMAIHPEVAYPAVSRFDLTKSVEVVNSHTVRFHFKKAYPDALFDTQMPILPKHILGKMAPKEIVSADFNRNPVGNGPFKLEKWDANRQVVFQANENFALGRPALDKVAFIIIPNESVLLSELMSGKLDHVPYLSPDGFQQVADNPELSAMKYAGRSYKFIAWNLRRPTFSHEIRQALTMGIDKQEIIATLMNGLAKPAKGPLPPFTWAYDKSLSDISFDPQKAADLLANAGWKDTDGDGIRDKKGKPMTFSIKSHVGSQVNNDIAVMVQAQLKKIGVQVDVEIVEWNLLLDQVFGESNFDALVLSWDTDFTVNPSSLWHSSAVKNGYNFVAYKNPRVDELLETGRNISSQADALPYWHEFQQIVLTDAPYTFLFIPEKLAGVNRRLKGIQPDVRGFLNNVDQWWISNEIISDLK